jgi:hypothetical protein
MIFQTIHTTLSTVKTGQPESVYVTYGCGRLKVSGLICPSASDIAVVERLWFGKEMTDIVMVAFGCGYVFHWQEYHRLFMDKSSNKKWYDQTLKTKPSRQTTDATGNTIMKRVEW